MSRRWYASVTGGRSGETTPGARRGWKRKAKKEERNKRELIREGTRKLRVSSRVGVTHRRCVYGCGGEGEISTGTKGRRKTETEEMEAA